MDEAAAVYRLRAEQCLALALEARDEVHREQSIEMAMYWFKLVESTNGGKAPEGATVGRDGMRRAATTQCGRCAPHG
jgi:hypothetical protein